MMILRSPFQQTALIASDSLGICMRATFKWLALKVAGGRFKFEKLNVGKTERKNSAYGDPFIKKICDKNFSALDPAQSQAYVNEDVDSTRKYVNLWGQRVVDADKKTFTGITSNESLAIATLSDYYKSANITWNAFHAIYTFYMQMSATEIEEILGAQGQSLTIGHVKVEDTSRTIMAGHVVGISGSDNTCFDANYGEYTFDPTDPLTIIRDIEGHITLKYKPASVFKRGITRLSK